MRYREVAKPLLKLRVGKATRPRQGRYPVPMSSNCSLTSAARFKLGDVRGAAWSGGVTFEAHAGIGGGAAGSDGAGIRAPCGARRGGLRGLHLGRQGELRHQGRVQRDWLRQASLPGRPSAVSADPDHWSWRSQQGLGQLAISTARAEGRSFPNSRTIMSSIFARKTLVFCSLSSITRWYRTYDRISR